MFLIQIFVSAVLGPRSLTGGWGVFPPQLSSRGSIEG
jgi:hypothetical protein